MLRSLLKNFVNLAPDTLGHMHQNWFYPKYKEYIEVGSYYVFQFKPKKKNYWKDRLDRK